MPIYEYQCEACGHDFETLQKISDAPLTECPQCGKAALKKLISAPAFRLKGGGWYETDFKTGEKRMWPRLTARPSRPPKKIRLPPLAVPQARKKPAAVNACGNTNPSQFS